MRGAKQVKYAIAAEMLL